MYNKGFGGMGGGNMQNLMRQAQKMQEEMLRQQKEAEEKLANTVLSASSGGGMVTVEITGDKKITSVKIKPEAVDPDDVEMLEDMIQACVNEAISKANELEKEVKPNLLGGM
ncbi:MAG: YbaB/EbfC family nucleoid-associated protein [Firmicutes bacterium]|nr:YbaB/EbfC family nucleoid-associated protein [Bacillota bacterium]MDY5041571.1 YbaB/EbfC family nucleoid-associated protein [Eubacteriales bacterium]